MMMTIVIGKATDALKEFLAKNGGKYAVDATWVNKWLAEKKAPFKTVIIDESGKELPKAKVLISITK